jgi:superfamily II DNA or RNA helicase|nr:DEAD/DEAH box helicase [Kofleriaceae bacterium]
MFHEGADRACPEVGRCTPVLRLAADTLFVEGAKSDEVTTAVLRLDFEYGPGRRVRCGSRMRLAERDLAAEATARRTLEGLGAIELSAFDDVAASPGANADYVIAIEPDPHALCAFSAYALPQLRDLGWRVEIAADYPWQVVDSSAPLYVSAREDDRRPDWFGIEMGVQMDGKTIDLVPALLDLLDGCSDLAALVRPTRRCVAVRVDGTRWLTVPPAQLARLAKTLLELYRRGPSLTARALQIGAIAELCSALHDGPREMTWLGDPSIRERAFAVALGPRRVDAPMRLRAELRPYQRDGVAWLQHLRAHDAGGVLADDMGLGKTLQTIAHVAIEHEHGRLDRPAMIVTLTSLVGNWLRELEKFAPHLRAVAYHGPDRRDVMPKLVAGEVDVVVTTYPIVARDRDDLATVPLHMVVLDEAHAIKNVDAQAADAVRALDAGQRVCLTGTPIENHLGELWSLLDFVNPGLLGGRDEFAQQFRVPIEQRGDRTRLVALRERVKPFILRRTKQSVAPELPPKTNLVRAIELTGAQRELYESIRVAAHADVRNHIKQRGLARSTIAVLDALLKLRQVCCDPRLVSLDGPAPSEGASAKLDALLQLVDRGLADGRRILIFSQFARMLALISESMLARGVRHVTLTGQTADRQRPIDAFQGGKADVFLISLKAGGAGLNLTGADTVIHYDPWWNPAAQAQATDRAHRIGQDKPVFVHDLIAAGSVEERMLGLQRHKRRLADAVLDAGPASAGALTERDIDDLLAPLD